MRRRPDRKTAQLQSVPALAAGRPRDLRALARSGELVDVDEGRHLLRAGLRPREAYVLLAGGVEAVADGAVVARFGPGDVVGLAEELGGVAAVADALTTEPVQALALTGRELRALLATNEALRRLAFRQLARQAREGPRLAVAA